MERDLRAEVNNFFENERNEDRKFSFMDTEDREALEALSAEDRADVEAFLTSAASRNIIGDSAHFTYSSMEAAEARLEASGSDALYPIRRYLERHPSTPLQEHYTSMLVNLADAATVPLLLSYLEDDAVLAGAMDDVMRNNLYQAFENALGRTRDAHWRSPAWLSEVAGQLIALRNRQTSVSDPYPLLRLIALTGSDVAQEYLRMNIGALDSSAQDALMRGEFYPHTRLNWSDGRRQDDYDDYDGYDDDYGRYDYEDDHHDVPRDPMAHWSGPGLSVAIGGTEANINFMPRGRTEYSPEYRTEFLLTGYEDFKAVLEAMDAGNLHEIETFRGRTNREMARASFILGFSSDRTLSSSGRHEVTATTEDVRHALLALELRGRGGDISLLEKMRERVSKSQRRKIHIVRDVEDLRS